MRKSVKRVLKSVPVVRNVVHANDARLETIRLQTDEIIGLQQAVTRLEQRNDEWSREVHKMRNTDEVMRIIWPVAKEDIKRATVPNIATVSNHPLQQSSRLAWVIPPTGKISGGHTTIFRTIAGLEKLGYQCTVFVYDPQHLTDEASIKEILMHFPRITGQIIYGLDHLEKHDALFATSWHTAYPVYNTKTTARKYYFIQDFEPFFDPVGTYSILSENTYRFGLRGITLGSWMQRRLEQDYKMVCDSVELAVTPDEYFIRTSAPKRNKVVFYARPVTPRRGFELGILTLEEFHRHHPDIEIHLVGWDVANYDISFPYINHGIMVESELNTLYNEALAGLVLSFTNMSLLPLEMMAAGCVPVVNHGISTNTVGYRKFMTYGEPTPSQLCKALESAIRHDDRFRHDMSTYTNNFSWNSFVSQINTILLTD